MRPLAAGLPHGKKLLVIAPAWRQNQRDLDLVSVKKRTHPASSVQVARTNFGTLNENAIGADTDAGSFSSIPRCPRQCQNGGAALGEMSAGARLNGESC